MAKGKKEKIDVDSLSHLLELLPKKRGKRKAAKTPEELADEKRKRMWSIIYAAWKKERDEKQRLPQNDERKED